MFHRDSDFVVGKPEGKRPLGTLREDNIKMDLRK
jgi:hypothetical protein